MPTITFTEAAGGPVPAVEIEINLQGGGGLQSGEQIRSLMIVAERVAAGTSSADTLSPTAFADSDAAVAWFGANSPGAHMCAAAFDYDNRQTGSGKPKCQIWGAAVAEKATGTAPVQTLTFGAGPATSAGTFIFSIGGKRCSVNVQVGDVIADVKTATIAAWDALSQKDRCPVLLTDGGGGVVTVTGSVKGTHLNNIGLETIQDPDCAITDTWSGTTMGSAGGTTGAGPHASADFDAIIAALGSFYDAGQIVIPWTDEGTAGVALNVFNTVAPADFRDHVISMGNANNMTPCSLRMAWKSTAAKITNAIAALDTDDCERVSLLGAPYSIVSGSGTWEGEIAARYAAMRATQTHLGRSFNGLRFREVENPIAADNWTEAEKKTLIEGGCTPVAIPRGGDTLAIVRDVCCRTSYGVLDTMAMDCLDYIRNDFATALTAQERLSIVAEDADKPPVDFITDPGKIRGLLRSRADLLEQAGYMTNVATNWPNVVTNLSGSTLQLAIPVALIPALHNIMVRLDAAVPAGS